jgi:sulfhydrogenase subunit gamma (sulfur reductase)
VSFQSQGFRLIRSETRTTATSNNPYAPAEARVMRVQEVRPDLRIIDLRFADPELARTFTFAPGQFVLLSVLGVGEAPFSLPSSPTRAGSFQLVIRRAGSVTSYVFDHVREGDTIGIRGPLGHGYPVEALRGRNLLMAAHGLGIIAVRGLLQYVMDLRDQFGHVTLLYGAESPDQLLFTDELASLQRRGDAEVHRTVDLVRGRGWSGPIGPVHDLLADVEVDPAITSGIACGSAAFYGTVIEPMVARGLAKDRIYLSLERRMECGLGKCGHCAVGYTFTCLHGPVFTYWDALNLPELIADYSGDGS